MCAGKRPAFVTESQLNAEFLGLGHFFWDTQLNVPTSTDELITHHTHYLRVLLPSRVHFGCVDVFLLIHFNSLSTE